MKMTATPIVMGAPSKKLVQGLEDLEITGQVGDHPNNSIFEIVQNTGKSPGDLRKLIVTHTPVGNHLLTLM